MKNLNYFFLVILTMLVISCIPTGTTNPTYPAETGLSDTDLVKFENIGIDSVTTFNDLKFSDGTNISEWMANFDSTFLLPNKQSKANECNLYVCL